MQKISEAKKELLELEQAGKYFFHGSAEALDYIDPRQAYTEHTGNKETDDKPGVHATPMAEVAIYMAVINQRSCPKGYLTGFQSGNNIDGMRYLASKETMEQLTNNQNAYGFVHVINHEDYSFVKRDEFQYISYDKVKPTKVIKVTVEDIPTNIHIISR